MRERAVIYARVSTDMQRGNYSIPSQVVECLRYVQEQRYLLLGNQFVDPETGLDVEQQAGATPAYVDDYTSREISRPSLDAVLTYLEIVGFDVLIVHAVDRLARDPYIRQTLEREIKALGARVEYVLGTYDETPEGEVRKDLEATFAKWEIAKRVERSNRGKIRKAKKGKFVTGKVPYGYRIDSEAFGGLAVDPDEAATVQRIFELYVVEEKSIRAIIEILTREGHEPYTHGGKWAKSSVKKILETTNYAGYFFYNKYKRNGKKIRLKPKSEWIKIECTPLVSQELFEKSQAIKANNRAIQREQPHRFYLLGGMVHCSRCGYAYLAQTHLPQKRPSPDGKIHSRHSRQTYRHKKSSGHCMNREISARKLEKIVWEKVLGILLHPEALRDGYEQSFQEQKSMVEEKKALIHKLGQKLDKTKRYRGNLNMAFVDPDIKMTKDEYLDQKERIEAEEKEIQEKLQTAHFEIKNLPKVVEAETLETFAKEIMTGLLPEDGEVSPKRKREILEMMHINVILFPDSTVQLEGWINPPQTKGTTNPVPGWIPFDFIKRSSDE